MAETKQVLLHTNGIQEVDGTVSPVYGSTSNTVTQGNDARLSTQGVLHVKKNPGAGEYSSVKAAVDAASLVANSSNPHTVLIGPGIYQEDTITLPSFVTVKSAGHSTVVIEPTDSNNDIVQVASANARFQGCTLRGATGAGAAAIRVTSATSPLIVDFVTIQNCTVGISVESSTTASQATLRNVRISSGTTTEHFLKVTAANNFDAVVRIWSALYTDDDGTAFVSAVRISGEKSRVDANNLFMRSTVGVGAGFQLRDGAELVSQAGAEAEGFDTNLWVENVGVAPIIRTTTVMLSRSITWDFSIEHPGTTGSLEAKADINGKIYVHEDAPIKLILADPNPAHNTGIFVRGDVLQADRFDRRANLSKIAREATTLGVVDGGVLSPGAGSLDLDVTAGSGFIIDPVDFFIKEVTWTGTTLSLPADSNVYIYVDTNGMVTAAASFPSLETVVLLGRANTDTDINFIERSRMSMQHVGNRLALFNRDALGPVYQSGTTVAESGTRNLDVTAGVYFYGVTRYAPSGGAAIEFSSYYRDGLGGYNHVHNITQVDNAQFDDGSGTLAALGSGNYAKHVLYLVGDGTEEHYFLVYSQDEYSSLVLAEGASLPTPPPYFDNAVVPIAAIIVQEGTSSLISIQDIRPIIGFKAAGVSASADHGNLFGLLDDDHPQYLLVSGARAMTGPLNMGAQAITNVGNVDGVDVSAHVSRHLPNGADPLTTAAAVTIGANNANGVGTNNSFSRSDHTHAVATAAASTQTPDQANAAGVSNNLARADHTHNIPTAAPSTIGTANTQGTTASFSRSDHIHNHGAQTDPTHHAVATQSAHGFMSSTDKAKLDGISGTRIFKSGVLTPASFTGNPKKATLTFGTPFPNTNYSVSILGPDGRMWSYESLLAGSVVVNSNSNTTPTGDVMWMAFSHGETVE